MKTIMEEAGAAAAAAAGMASAAAATAAPVECSNDRLQQPQGVGLAHAGVSQQQQMLQPHMEPGDSSKPPKLKKKTVQPSKRSQRSANIGHRVFIKKFEIVHVTLFSQFVSHP